jgi:hypothetical protein
MIASPTHTRCMLLAGLILGAGFSAGHADVVLDGDYLRVGVHTSGGLINDAFTVGIDYDQTGTSSWTGFDFLKPGTPREFYAIGVGGASSAAGYDSGNPFAASTIDVSAGPILSTLTTGAYNDLSFSQTLWYNRTSGTIDFSVTLTNNGLVALSEVVYARGLDPDQDVYAGGGYPTTNVIVNPNLVIASAPVTDWTIGIFTNSEIAHTASIRSDWSRDPYSLLSPINNGNGDYTINMAWNVGTLGAGASTTITFQYRIAETSGGVVNPPGVPDAASTLGLLALGLAGVAACGRRFRASQS